MEQNYKDRELRLKTIVADIRDRNKISRVYAQCRPQIVIHAAAYKHVPLVEHNPTEGIKNNVFGTLCTAQAAL